MPLDFSTRALGLNHKPAWGVQGLEAVLSYNALKATLPRSCDWHKAMGLDTQKPDALGNQTYGCCCEAGTYRLAQIRMANAMGSRWKPDTAKVLALYSKITGFNLVTCKPDQGTDVASLQRWIWRNGLDLGLQAPDVPIPVALDHTNLDHLYRAAWLLGGIGLSFALPTGWQTSALWNAGAGDPGSWGCHFVPSARFSGKLWYVISWGWEIPCTEAAIQQYCVGAIAWVSRMWVEASGLSPTGLTWDDLQAVRQGLDIPAQG